MGDFDGGHRGSGRVISVVLAVLVLGVGAGAAGIWIGRETAAAAGPEPTSAAAGVSMPPPWPWPAGATPPPQQPVGTVDAGLGWAIPNPGAAGPFSVTDQGVPFGYRQDLDGAALAAVNAVVAGKYLAATFVDPWSALGFLADPGYADRGGNHTLEAFFTGPRVHQANDTTTPAPVPAPATPAGSTGGGRVVGVQATQAATPAGAVRAVVLWQSFSGEFRPDGQQGYTVRIAPVSVLLVWAAGDWKVAQVSGPPIGMDTVVLGVLPPTFPVPAENWHR